MKAQLILQQPEAPIARVGAKARVIVELPEKGQMAD